MGWVQTTAPRQLWMGCALISQNPSAIASHSSVDRYVRLLSLKIFQILLRSHLTILLTVDTPNR
jgi:hypothetical protein